MNTAIDKARARIAHLTKELVMGRDHDAHTDDVLHALQELYDSAYSDGSWDRAKYEAEPE